VNNVTITELQDCLENYINDGFGDVKVYMTKDGMIYTPTILLEDNDEGELNLIISDC
jgi:hypothetical protein